jgi:hypothetical protein
MRVIAVLPLREADRAIALVAGLPPPARFAGRPLQAPILYLPNVFEPALCTRLIAAYDTQGGKERGSCAMWMARRSGFTTAAINRAEM